MISINTRNISLEDHSVYRPVFKIPIGDVPYNFCKGGTLNYITTRFQGAHPHSDIFQAPSIWGVCLEASWIYITLIFVFCDTHHKNVYSPNKTIEQCCSRICIWKKCTPFHGLGSPWWQPGSIQGISASMNRIIRFLACSHHFAWPQRSSSCLRNRVSCICCIQNTRRLPERTPLLCYNTLIFYQ